jgi:hypothetical protein
MSLKKNDNIDRRKVKDRVKVHLKYSKRHHMNKKKEVYFLLIVNYLFFINLLKQADACETKFNHRRDIVDKFT